MRLIFAGTPEAAVPSLRALLASRHEVLAVLTRPDAPTGRGRRLAPSPVRRVAEDAGIEVLTPASLRDPALLERLRALAPDAAPVVAYGALVPPDALTIPLHGWVNLHFSSLPRWRGAAPAQRAVLAGDAEAGLSVFRLDAGLDTGDLIARATSPIGETETAGELLDRLAIQGADLLVSALDAIEDGTAEYTPQSEVGATRAAKLTVAEARIDFYRPHEVVSAQIRGMSPDPGAWTLLRGERFKILGVEPVRAAEASAMPALAPGEIAASKRSVLVGTASTPVALGTVAPTGKRPMRAPDWARGAQLAPGDAFTAPDRTSQQEDR